MNFELELQHLRVGANLEEVPSGIGLIEFTVSCPLNATSVISRVQETLEIVLGKISRTQKMSLQDWEQQLPQWLIQAFQSQPSEPIQPTWWQNILTLGKAEAEQSWSLENWLYWFEPQNRNWFWWSASVISANQIKLILDVQDYPLTIDALRWLFLAAEATDFEEG